jgi:hypothetical protein
MTFHIEVYDDSFGWGREAVGFETRKAALADLFEENPPDDPYVPVPPGAQWANYRARTFFKVVSKKVYLHSKGRWRATSDADLEEIFEEMYNDGQGLTYWFRKGSAQLLGCNWSKDEFIAWTLMAPPVVHGRCSSTSSAERSWSTSPNGRTR